MKAVIQRCKRAKLDINDKEYSKINQGLLILLGIGNDDDIEDIKWLSGKISKMRIFSDDLDKMNLSITDIDGDIMVVSQFTLYASIKKGNRPGYTKSASPEKAIPLYDSFVEQIKNDSRLKVVTGKFGAMMNIELVNDGPVTIIIDSKNRE